jgi:hypothetical protein
MDDTREAGALSPHIRRHQDINLVETRAAQAVPPHCRRSRNHTVRTRVQ